MTQEHNENNKDSGEVVEGGSKPPIYYEDTDSILIEQETANTLLTHLQKIEKQMKEEGVWSPVQTQSDTWFMPLPEWITLVMIPRDTKNLERLFLPKNYAVGGMAGSEQSQGVLPKLSPDLVKLLREYEEMLASLRNVEGEQV